jgi:hypothetical protein
MKQSINTNSMDRMLAVVLHLVKKGVTFRVHDNDDCSWTIELLGGY